MNTWKSEERANKQQKHTKTLNNFILWKSHTLTRNKKGREKHSIRLKVRQNLQNKTYRSVTAASYYYLEAQYFIDKRSDYMQSVNLNGLFWAQILFGFNQINLKSIFWRIKQTNDMHGNVKWNTHHVVGPE